MYNDIDGTSRSDNLLGTALDDRMRGYEGNDTMNGGRGDDLLYGSSGSDILTGSIGENDYWGGSGHDRFVVSQRGAASSDDYIHDFSFNEDTVDLSAWGVSDFSQVWALFLSTDSHRDAALNAVWGGYDHILTLEDIDYRDLISSDFNYSAAGSKNETATAFADTMFGSRNADTLSAGNANDTVLGGIGNDRLAGQDDNDALLGNAGRDIMAGGEGADAFVYLAPTDTGLGAARDVISDFEQGLDWIDLSVIDANPSKSGHQSFDWRGSNPITGPGQLNYAIVSGNTIVSANITGSNAPDFQIVVSGVHALTADDFIL